MKTVAVAATVSENPIAAKKLARQYGFAFMGDPQDRAAAEYDYLLVVTPNFIGLHKTSDKKFAPFYIDFLSGKMRYRSEQAGLRKELLARALGCKPSDSFSIIDATAGLGRDSFILASLGFNVTMFERSPILYVLLEDALQRIKQNPEMAEIAGRMKLINADAIEQFLTIKADIIYLDPMFPDRKKSASVKKEMAIIQDLLGKSLDCDKLFEAAMACANKRVVVKRPRLAANIGDHAPNFALNGKNSRFDVYLTLRKSD